MMKRKVVHIASGIENSLGLEWLFEGLSSQYEVTVILLNADETQLERNLRQRGIGCINLKLTSKWTFFPVFVKLVVQLLRIRPEIVHVHLLDAQRLGLPAAWLVRVKRRFYTRHNSTFHHRYFPSGILYDRLSNWFSTAIVSISQATDYTLIDLEGVSRSKVVRIHHGFDFTEFGPASPARIAAVREKWKIPAQKPVIGMVSRFIEWKGIAYALEAVKGFRQKFPDTFLVLANARGPQTEALLRQLKDFPTDSYVRIPFEEDAAALYGAFDMFVHVPIDEHVEAFGQAYIEALACGLPCVFTRSGIAAEYFENDVHALFVAFRNAEAIETALERLWMDMTLRERVASAGAAFVRENFKLETMIARTEALYNA